MAGLVVSCSGVIGGAGEPGASVGVHEHGSAETRTQLDEAAALEQGDKRLRSRRRSCEIAARGDAMRAFRFPVLPLAALLIAGAAAGQTAQAEQAGQTPVRLVVFEDFMRPT